MIDITQHSLYKPMEVDSVLSNIFNTYLKKFAVLFVSSFVAAFIIQVVFYQFGFFELTKLGDPEEILSAIAGMRNEIIIGSITYFVIYGILICFLINYLIRSDLDSTLSIQEIFVESVKNNSVHLIFFLILSMLIIIAGAFLGIIVFIIGSFLSMIYLGTVLVPGGTIIVAEEKNAFEAIRRAFTLTHKDFWSTLGAVILYFLIMILISIVMNAILAIPFILKFVNNWRETENFFELFNMQTYDIGSWVVLLNSLVAAITYPFFALLSVVLYLKLRFLEDKKTIVQ
ncbi:MAG: hypothetical protein PF485_10220 [Bacteroidales bacterium]|jgi:hypothetical protein|nr:hypothetical protein [Bacteroidales bacterium]